ncbi:hypothetical protein PPERSA_06202 [Pseudocohnilembus persalinus]|uniref:Uncharacterized protein n=1 Tax=Pseudocohnilembus persalinus TaxID=266149 RepID=A0A0V0R1J4_PSEPJ|nr:hypothetical protein PPERSA_06202 [Pseudocohnilembus persalinus]|eukprot:KRX08024.1 hypothetical protein PPERSA_06202 [Pseudocohnilembus persalinus]
MYQQQKNIYQKSDHLEYPTSQKNYEYFHQNQGHSRYILPSENQNVPQNLIKNVEFYPHKLVSQVRPSPPVYLQPPKEISQYKRGNQYAEFQPYQYERPIIARKKLEIGLDRPFSQPRYYDIFQPYHRNLYDQQHFQENQGHIVDYIKIKPEWEEWRGCEDFANILNQMLQYELKAEKLKFDLVNQPDFNIGGLYTLFINSTLDKEQKIENQEEACQKNLYFSSFSKGIQDFDIFADAYFKTNVILGDLLRLLLSQEDAQEFFRKEVLKRKIEMDKIWLKINPAMRNSVQVEHIRCFLMNYNFHYSREQVKMLLHRINKQNKFDVTFEQIYDEFKPRSFIFKQQDKENIQTNLDIKDQSDYNETLKK